MSKINRRRLLLSAGAAGLAAIAGNRPAMAACQPKWDQCDPVPENEFRHGTRTDQTDCALEFRLPSELLSRQGIILADGTYSWTLRLITFNRNGRPRWQQAHRVDNSPVRRQSVYFGTTVATYITCDLFTGWYSTGVIRTCSQPLFRRVDWPFDWQQLERAVGS